MFSSSSSFINHNDLKAYEKSDKNTLKTENFYDIFNNSKLIDLYSYNLSRGLFQVQNHYLNYKYSKLDKKIHDNNLILQVNPNNIVAQEKLLKYLQRKASYLSHTLDPYQDIINAQILLMNKLCTSYLRVTLSKHHHQTQNHKKIKKMNHDTNKEKTNFINQLYHSFDNTDEVQMQIRLLVLSNINTFPDVYGLTGLLPMLEKPLVKEQVKEIKKVSNEVKNDQAVETELYSDSGFDDIVNFTLSQIRQRSNNNSQDDVSMEQSNALQWLQESYRAVQDDDHSNNADEILLNFIIQESIQLNEQKLQQQAATDNNESSANDDNQQQQQEQKVEEIDNQQQQQEQEPIENPLEQLEESKILQDETSNNNLSNSSSISSLVTHADISTVPTPIPNISSTTTINEIKEEENKNDEKVLEEKEVEIPATFLEALPSYCHISYFSLLDTLLQKSASLTCTSLSTLKESVPTTSEQKKNEKQQDDDSSFKTIINKLKSSSNISFINFLIELLIHDIIKRSCTFSETNMTAIDKLKQQQEEEEEKEKEKKS